MSCVSTKNGICFRSGRVQAISIRGPVLENALASTEGCPVTFTLSMHFHSTSIPLLLAFSTFAPLSLHFRFTSNPRLHRSSPPYFVTIRFSRHHRRKQGPSVPGLEPGKVIIFVFMRIIAFTSQRPTWVRVPTLTALSCGDDEGSGVKEKEGVWDCSEIVVKL